MRLTVLMPMGGLGSRFAEAGFDTPKPMIDIDGRPMFLRALESYPSSWDIDYVFVIRKDQDDIYGLKALIEAACPQALVAILDYDTRGAVETCLQAEGFIDSDNPVIVSDCDVRFSSKEYVGKIIGPEVYDGVLVGFESADPRYSYADLNEEGDVMRTAEKIPISSHAILGGYYFGSGALFLKYARRFVSSGLPQGLKEFYLSHLFNMLLADGCRVGYAKADFFDSWGTPEELTIFECKEARLDR